MLAADCDEYDDDDAAMTRRQRQQSLGLTGNCRLCPWTGVEDGDGQIFGSLALEKWCTMKMGETSLCDIYRSTPPCAIFSVKFFQADP